MVMLMMYIYNHLHLMGFHVKKTCSNSPQLSSPRHHRLLPLPGRPPRSPRGEQKRPRVPRGPRVLNGWGLTSHGEVFFWGFIWFNIFQYVFPGDFRGISWDITNFIMIQCIPFLNGNFIIGRVRIIHRKWRYPIFREFLWVSAGCKRYWGDGKG